MKDSGNKSPLFRGSSRLKGRVSIHWREEEPYNVLVEVHLKQSGGLVSLSGDIHTCWWGNKRASQLGLVPKHLDISQAAAHSTVKTEV